MALREQFDRLTAEVIRGYVAEEQVEHLHLDFKQVASDPLKGPDDLRNLAKALSGFANADGGIIVWGVEARKNNRGVNCAKDGKPVNDLRLFLSRLIEHSGASVNPIVDGVIHKMLIETGNSGFVATFVPASDGGPHMAKQSEDRYYKRTNDRFAKMEHYEIQDMFGRRKRPALRLRCVTEPPIMGLNETRVVVAIENIGRGAAIAPYLALRVNGPNEVDRYGLDGNGRTGLAALLSTHKNWKHFGGALDTVIHPGTVREVTKVVANTHRERGLLVSFRIAAEGVGITDGELRFSDDDLLVEGVEKVSGS